jgi:TetR/AcrR family transcriptional regulator, cholesterol catabolism regulator
MPRQPRTAAPRKTPRSRTPEVLEAAVTIFATKGYENTSMQEIGETLGLLKGSIYYYVDSKEELLFSVIKAVHSEMMANLEKAKTRESDDEVRLRAFLEDMIELTIDRLEHATVFQREFRHLSDEHRSEISRERRQYEKFFEALLSEGQREGRVRTDIAVKVLSVAGLTMITAIPTWYRRSGKLSKREMVSDYAELLISAYRPARR